MNDTATPTRAAIVTGASAGIGLAVATALCEDGWAVTITARREERLEGAAERLRTRAADASSVTSVVSNVAADDAGEALVATHVAQYGRLDLVVANAGWGTNGSVADGSPADLERMLRTNVSANFALAQAAMPALRAQRGWFVISSSMSGVWPTAGFAGYSAAKAAALSLARSIAAEEATNGVRACAICPAFVRTDMTTWLGDALPADAMLQPADVAASVRYLLALSPNASVTELVLRRTGAPDPYAP